MDWFSWLSRTNLDPSLVYDYGLVLARNELQKEDLVYFNHEFLQSMGISVAKHRLEILKLAKKEDGGLVKLFSALNKTRTRLAKRIVKWVFHDDSSVKRLPEPPCREQRKSGAPATKKAIEFEPPVLMGRRIAKSGPIDRRMQEKLMLDRNVHERLVFTYRSPVLSGPLDGKSYNEKMNKSLKFSGSINGRPASPRVYTDYTKEKMVGGGGGCGDDDDHHQWTSLFQDMEPT